MKTKALLVLCSLAALILGIALLVPLRRSGAPGVSVEPSDPLASTPTRKPRLPAPGITPAPASPDAQSAATRPPDWVTRLLNGEWPAKPTAEDLRAYLDANGRGPDALLAASRATEESALLEEAAATYTNNAKVAFAAFFHSKSPEDRRRLLETLKQTTPDNALGFYLSAREYFNAGETDQAVAELMAASSKPRWQDFSADYMLNAEEAYRAFGYSETEAKTVAAMGLPLPHLSQLRDLGKQIGELAARYRETGDDASALSALRIGLNLARRVGEGSGPDLLIQDLVGISTERNILTTVDPSAPYDNSGLTVKDRLDQLDARRDQIKALGKQADSLLQGMSDQDLSRYIDRWKTSGERGALEWLAERKASP